MFIQFIVNAHNVRKTPKMANFDHIFDVYSIQYNRIVLIHFSSCQTSPWTSLEYPHHMHLIIFENWPFWAIFGPFWAIFEAIRAISSKSICILSDFSWDKFRVPTTHTFRKIRTMRLFLKLSIFGHFWAVLGHFWACTDHLEQKYPRVGTLNLCQKMTDKILKDSWQYVH